RRRRDAHHANDTRRVEALAAVVFRSIGAPRRDHGTRAPASGFRDTHSGGRTMKHALDLWSWQGVASRRAYVLAGAALFAVKYPLDWGVSAFFDRPWNPLMYLSPRVSPLFKFNDHPAYWFTLLAVALPFAAAGVSLSARRLRDVGVHPFWAGLFFLPFL